MRKKIEQAITRLRDTKAMWTERRDAVEQLGEVARRALRALREHENDADTDVRMAVERALREVDTPTPEAIHFSEQPRDEAPHTHTLEALAQACSKPESRLVEQNDDGFTIKVRIDEERWQTVYMREVKGPNGMPILRVATYCGQSEEKAKQWAMRNNGRLVNCAFAIEGRGEDEQIILVENLDRRWASPDAVRAAVKEVAFYGDFLERKLTGLDEL